MEVLIVILLVIALLSYIPSMYLDSKDLSEPYEEFIDDKLKERDNEQDI